MAHDVIIVGGGLAGLFCALKLAPRPVTLVTAAPIGTGTASGWAQGGIAAAIGDGDTPQAHAQDTIAAGAGIVNEEIALAMAREGPARLIDLMAYGVPFDTDADGHLMLSQEAAHSARRIARVKGDQAGREIMRALAARVKETPSMGVLNGFYIEELVMRDRRVVGLSARVDDRMVTLPASAVVLATGGVGGLYAVTTNPPEARGTGLAMAARAGARIADPEFVQFHPTAIAIGRDPAPLATEALRGEGATLVNNRGERFMTQVHPDAELAPRDIVARAVFNEIAASRGAFLDARTAIGAAFAQKFPGVYASCMAAGIDPAKRLIPIAPAAHYHMGGIAVDAHGHSSLDGLWAIGEVASTGVHGANRLASNSLLEAAVFAARAAAQISGMPAGRNLAPLETVPATPLPATNARERRLRTLMANEVGVVRNGDGLARAVVEITRMERDAPTIAFRNAATAALLIAAAALARRESRGAHFRSDFPQTESARAYHTTMTLADARAIAEKAGAPALAS